MKKKIPIYVFFIPFVLVSLSLFVFHFIPNDTVQYSMLGYNLFHHGFYNDSYGVVPGWIQSPGWPFLTGIFSLLFPLQLSAILPSLAISLSILPILFIFLKKTFNVTVGVLTIGIIALNPEFLITARSGLSEPFYMFLNVLIFFRLYLLVIRRKALSFTELILLSIATVWLIFTRSEGILYAVLIGLIFLRFSTSASSEKFLFVPSRLQGIFHVIVYTLILSSVLYPYGNWVKQKSGAFNIIPKLTFNMRMGNVAHMLSRQKGVDPKNEDEMEELGWFALDPHVHALYSSRILNNAYYQTLKIRNGMQIRMNLFISRMIFNFKNMIRVLIRSNPFPLFFLVLIIIGLYYLFRKERGTAIFILIWLLPSFYFMLSHVEERFFYVFLPYLSFTAAYGLYALSQKTKNLNFILNTTLILLMLNSALYYKEHYEFLQKKEVFYVLSQDIKRTIPAEARVCAKGFSTTFYSGNDFLKMPICSPNELYSYMNKQGASYLLLGNEVNNLRREFKPIFENKLADKFAIVKTFPYSSQRFKLFKTVASEKK